MSARERIAYLKGLLEGRPPEDEHDRVLYGAVVHALDALADQMDEQADSLAAVVEDLEDLIDYCDDLGEGLEVLEDAWGQGLCGPNEQPGDAEEDSLRRSVLCPACSTVLYCRSNMSGDGEMIRCPECKRSFPLSEVELEEG